MRVSFTSFPNLSDVFCIAFHLDTILQYSSFVLNVPRFVLILYYISFFIRKEAQMRKVQSNALNMNFASLYECAKLPQMK